MTVYLVGAGPGDPGLMTLRGAELVGEANVIVFDRLIEPAVLAMASSNAILIDAGKRAGSSEMTQREINNLLIERARKGELVVRLKGGDPFVFGRGGEEAEALEDAGVSYEVVPGVSSVAAVPSAAGVPLTMRGMASSVTVVTGHDPAALERSISFAALAASQTLVFLMGNAHRAELASRLIAAGKDPATKVLVVVAGTTAHQKSVRTTLDGLGSIDVSGPTTIVVGDVAGLSFASYEQRPLFSWRVVVARALEEVTGLVRMLASAGAVPIEIVTTRNVTRFDRFEAARHSELVDADVVTFTSPSTVTDYLLAVGFASLARVVASIGPPTTKAAEEAGIMVDFEATVHTETGLFDAIRRFAANHPRPSSTDFRTTPG